MMGNDERPQRILLTGANGQLGKAVQRQAMADELDFVALRRTELDITDAASVVEAARYHRPTHILNAAAYTAVDRAEEEPEQAYAINRDGVRNLARAAKRHGAQMLQVSTDYVFDGEHSRPYRPDDTPNPINVYGASKLKGEQAVMEETHGEALILRTAWVYSLDGHNFLTTMRRLMRERDELPVVEDEVGTPTATSSLASVLLTAAQKHLNGIHHWTDAGVASWYDFSIAIRELERAAGRLERVPQIRPITASEFPRTAKRPSYSVLERAMTRRELGGYGVAWVEKLGELLRSAT